MAVLWNENDFCWVPTTNQGLLTVDTNGGKHDVKERQVLCRVALPSQWKWDAGYPHLPSSGKFGWADELPD